MERYKCGECNFQGTTEVDRPRCSKCRSRNTVILPSLTHFHSKNPIAGLDAKKRVKLYFQYLDNGYRKWKRENDLVNKLVDEAKTAPSSIILAKEIKGTTE